MFMLSSRSAGSCGCQLAVIVKRLFSWDDLELMLLASRPAFRGLIYSDYQYFAEKAWH